MSIRYRLRLAWWRTMKRLVTRFVTLNVVSANMPDYPSTDPDRWITLDRGHWGTLAATKIGSNVLLSVWKGFDQGGTGVVLTRETIQMLVDYADAGR